MLIKLLLELVYSIIDVAFVFDLPNLPDTVNSIIIEFIKYLNIGFQVLCSFIGPTAMGVLCICVGFVLFAHSMYMTISFLFWFLRKIPMLNIKE